MNLPDLYNHLRSGRTIKLQLTDQCAHIELCARLQLLAMQEGFFLRVTEHPRTCEVYICLMDATSFERLSA